MSDPVLSDPVLPPSLPAVQYSERQQNAAANCPISTQDAASALQLLNEAAARRRENIEGYSAERDEMDDEEEFGSASPILDRMIEKGGTAAYVELTNFSNAEFHQLWDKVSGFVSENWGAGRGRRSSFTPKDVFFMILVTCKQGGAWDWIGRMFNIKGPTFQKMITRFIDMLAPFMHDCFVKKVTEQFTMTRLMSTGRTFSNYACARYAVDVTFQRAERPSGSVAEGKKYFSGKHKAYGFKSEVSVLPNGLALGVTAHEPASVADIDIFRKNAEFHDFQLDKLESELELLDLGPYKDLFPRMWAALADKGYQGGRQDVRVIHPKKKPAGRHLSTMEIEENRLISSDRIIVENYFGRLCSLWGVTSGVYKWAEKHYDSFFMFCIAATNFHIRIQGLRDEDGEFYRRYENRIISITRDTAKKGVVLERGIDKGVAGDLRVAMSVLKGRSLSVAPTVRRSRVFGIIRVHGKDYFLLSSRLLLMSFKCLCTSICVRIILERVTQGLGIR